jgi:hypothetical protein
MNQAQVKPGRDDEFKPGTVRTVQTALPICMEENNTIIRPTSMAEACPKSFEHLVQY